MQVGFYMKKGGLLLTVILRLSNLFQLPVQTVTFPSRLIADTVLIKTETPCYSVGLNDRVWTNH